MRESIGFPLDQLHHSPINVRVNDDDVGDLIASIKSHGLLQPLVGRSRDDGAIEIIDGGRRLRALRAIAVEGVWAGDVPVMLRDDADEIGAHEMSLAANVVRRALHPVAEYEAFVALQDKGRSVEEIAAHFGVDDRAVRQRLALGRLHPDVRRAWREGRINGEAARALTVAAPDEQAAYLASAHSDWQMRAQAIRDHFTADAVSGDDRRVAFVGLDAYLAAGGALVADLFADPPDLADAALLDRLINERLAAEAERIKREEGWRDVVWGAAAQKRYQWDRMPVPALAPEGRPARLIEIDARLDAIEARRAEIEAALDELVEQHEDAAKKHPDYIAFAEEDEALADEEHQLSGESRQFDLGPAIWMSVPAEARACALAVVDVGDSGALLVSRGYLTEKPRQTTQTKTALAPAQVASGENDAPAPEPAQLSAALLNQLAGQSVAAAAIVLAHEPRLALAVFVASQVSWDGPARLTCQGLRQGGELPFATGFDEPTFEAALKHCLKQTDDRLRKWAATAIARSLDWTANAVPHAGVSSDAVVALRCALPVDPHRDALVEAFDADAYFKSAPKAESLAAIADCGDDPGKYAGKKKGDLAAIASRLAKEKSWLPQILRGEIFAAIDATEDALGETPAQAEAEAPETAAQATARIWSEEARASLDALSRAELKAQVKARVDEMKAAGRSPDERPTTRDEMIAWLIEHTPAPQHEAPS